MGHNEALLFWKYIWDKPVENTIQLVCNPDMEFPSYDAKGSVLAMREDVTANTFVKSEDAGKYFEVISVDLTAIPTCAYKSLDELPKDGFYIENAMTKTQMVMKDNIADKDIVMDKYKNGYGITSFPAESFDGGWCKRISSKRRYCGCVRAKSTYRTFGIVCGECLCERGIRQCR